MADLMGSSGGGPSIHEGGHWWRKWVAVALAAVLACASLVLLEHRSAHATSAPHAVPAAHAAAAAPHVAVLESFRTRLRGAASVINQTIPDLAPASAAKAAELAARATQAADLSQQLAATTDSPVPDVAQATSTASALTAALATTQAAAAAADPVTAADPFMALQFCPFTIQIGPIVIDIPAAHIHIVIGPFFIHFEAPCFLSGRIPTHLPR